MILIEAVLVSTFWMVAPVTQALPGNKAWALTLTPIAIEKKTVINTRIARNNIHLSLLSISDLWHYLRKLGTKEKNIDIVYTINITMSNPGLLGSNVIIYQDKCHSIEVYECKIFPLDISTYRESKFTILMERVKRNGFRAFAGSIQVRHCETYSLKPRQNGDADSPTCA